MYYITGKAEDSYPPSHLGFLSVAVLDKIKRSRNDSLWTPQRYISFLREPVKMRWAGGGSAAPRFAC
jgi:hypothetical protein